MENLGEVRKTVNVMLWWDGAYGGAFKNGRTAMLGHKPHIPLVGSYDTIICCPEHPTDKTINKAMLNGADDYLSTLEIDAISDMIDQMFPDQGGGGGGGGGVTNLRIDKSAGAILFTTETGGSGSLPFADLKATPMEFYLDVANPTKTVTIPFQVQGQEYVVPIGQVPMSGRSNFVTIDSVNNRVLVQESNLRGTIRLYGAFRFSPSVKSAMDLDLLWYYRRAGSSDAWTLIYQGNVKRTESQTTAALSFPTSSGYYDFPDHPVELEVRLRFNDFGDGRGEDVAWSTIPIFTDAGDGIKISLYKEPNYEYTT